MQVAEDKVGSARGDLRLEAGDLAGEQRIAGKFKAQAVEQLEGAGLVFFADVGDGQQNTCKGSEVVPVCGGGFKIGDPALLVGGQATHAENPAHRGGHAADDVFAEPGGEQTVIAIGADGEQLLRPGGSFLGEVERSQV